MAERYTAEIMIEAIKKNNGILAKAGQAIGCDRQTVANYIKRHPTVAAAYEEARETNIDFVESKLMQNIAAGDTVAIIFFLKTVAKDRGYIEQRRIDLGGVPDAPLVIVDR